MSILANFDSIPRLNQITNKFLVRRIEIYMKISIDSVKPEFFPIDLEIEKIVWNGPFLDMYQNPLIRNSPKMSRT